MKIPIFTSPPDQRPDPGLDHGRAGEATDEGVDELASADPSTRDRFQTMAPINAAKTTAWSTTLDSTTPFPTALR
jgi:hypothetical protein